MKKKIFAFMACFSMVLGLFGGTTQKANAETLEKVEPGYYDEHIIPDKYNTGVEEGVVLTEVHEEMQLGTVLSDDGGEPPKIQYIDASGYYCINSYSSGTLAAEVLIEGYSFCDFAFKTMNTTRYEDEKVITFKNCVFNGFQHDIHEISKLSFVFENCTFLSGLSGCNMTLNYCRIMGDPGGADGMNPFCNVTVNNCYFHNFPQTNSKGTHTDGVQIAGSTELAPDNIHFNNVRIEIPLLLTDGLATYINAPIMLSLDYNNASDISFRNCIVNGGGYSIYVTEKTYTMEDVVLENIQVGTGRKYGVFYPTVSESATITNVTETDKLYVSSVWKDDEGKVHVVSTNDTLADRELVVATNNGTETFTVESKASAEARGATTTEEVPMDVEFILNAEDVEYLVCYDTEVASENQIRFVNYGTDMVYRNANGEHVTQPDFSTGDMEINFTMTSSEINVTVPLNVLCFIDPNESEGFVHGDAAIVNNSTLPLKFYVQNFSVLSGAYTMLKPEGLAGVGINTTWEELTSAQSAQYLAIGVGAGEDAWYTSTFGNYAWANNISERFELGVIEAAGTAPLTFDARYGRSLKETSQIQLRLLFVAEICGN